MATIGGLSVVLITLLCILILGSDITSRSMFPSYSPVKKINIGQFFQRIEAFMAGLWFITTFFKTTFYFYSWTLSFAEILKFKDYRVVISGWFTEEKPERLDGQYYCISTGVDVLI